MLYLEDTLKKTFNVNLNIIFQFDSISFQSFKDKTRQNYRYHNQGKTVLTRSLKVEE